MRDIEYNIVKTYGVISEDKSGWRKELNSVQWNNRPAKLDLRDWSPDHEKMGKGLTLSKEEAEKLVELLNIALKD